MSMTSPDMVDFTTKGQRFRDLCAQANDAKRRGEYGPTHAVYLPYQQAFKQYLAAADKILKS